MRVVLKVLPVSFAVAVTISSSAAGATEIFSGSGVVIGARGEILTNAHVVGACSQITVHFSSGDSTTALVVARDENNDLAVVRSKPLSSVATLREGGPIRAGDAVVALGYPLSGLLATTANLSVGNVSALAGLGDDSRYLQISAPVQPGNSGGPLLDASGHLIGIVTAKLDAARIARFTGDIPQNVNFALKVEVARTFLDSKGITYQTARSEQQLSPADVGDIARPFTVNIDCVRDSSQSTAVPSIERAPTSSHIEAARRQCRGYDGRSSVASFSQEEADLMIKGCTAIIQSSPSAGAYINRGLAYFAKRQYDRAIVDYTDARVLGLTDPHVLYLRGNAYRANRVYREAVRDYVAAASGGYGEAANRLGLMYAVGEGVAQDYGTAMGWFLVAVDAGSSAAMSNVGELYAKGNGIPKDCNSARQWVEKAIVAGYEGAKQFLRSGFDGRCY